MGKAGMGRMQGERAFAFQLIAFSFIAADNCCIGRGMAVILTGRGDFRHRCCPFTSSPFSQEQFS